MASLCSIASCCQATRDKASDVKTCFEGLCTIPEIGCRQIVCRYLTRIKSVGSLLCEKFFTRWKTPILSVMMTNGYMRNRE